MEQLKPSGEKINKLKGKQIKDNTVKQNNFNVTTDSISNNNDITNKDYVITKVNNSMGGIYQSKLNQNMTANNATVGEKASTDYIIEFPISNVMVKINGIYVNVGETKDCYFSPDGLTIRKKGKAQKADYLYWNNSKYDLEDDDEIDLIYLVNYDHYVLDANSTVKLDPTYNNLVVKYTGGDGTSMTISIDDTDIIVGNSGGSFVWDIGGSNEYTFKSEYESITHTINNEDYTIWFDGFGSLIFSVKKGKEEQSGWIEINSSTNWAKRGGHTPVIDSNDIIYVIGGANQSTSEFFNDVWKSEDGGMNWIQQTSGASWGERSSHTSVIDSNDIIYVMGGVNHSTGETGEIFNDVWKSEDGGVNWTQQTSGASWTERFFHTSVIDSNDNIYVMGGYSTRGIFNDVWKSEDGGVNWTQQTSGASWTERFVHTSVIDSNDNIYVMGGFNQLTSEHFNDVWKYNQ